MKCAAGVGMHVDMTAWVSSLTLLDGDWLLRRPMMDLLIEVCARGRLNPTTHALVVPTSDGSGTVPTHSSAGTVPFTPSQSVQSLGVSTVRVVAKSQTLKPEHSRVSSSGTASSTAQPFEVHHPHCCLERIKCILSSTKDARILTYSYHFAPRRCDVLQ